mmetsp:Transcript_57059/g.90724  ORF Transcript_57059/g.90724 Transcript_57059/m.90724 type:complete len:97 (+) Transcript_57059:595-885(+)
MGRTDVVSNGVVGREATAALAPELIITLPPRNAGELLCRSSGTIVDSNGVVGREATTELLLILILPPRKAGELLCRCGAWRTRPKAATSGINGATT